LVYPSHIAHTMIGSKRYLDNNETEDSNVETQIINLVHVSNKPVKVGSELTLKASPKHPDMENRHNDQLLLEGGYMWNDLDSAAFPLQFKIDVDVQTKATVRKQLLKKMKFKGEFDWSVTTKPVPEKLLIWSRIMLAADDELDLKSGDVSDLLEDMKRPLSLKTETEVISNLLSGMDKMNSQYDHSIEEDDYILEKKEGLAIRARLAVQQRRLAKIVLQQQMQKLAERLEDYEQQKKKIESAKRSYNTQSERKALNKKETKKLKEREQKRSRWREKMEL